jgi:RNA polymerase sigma-70 factor (ECF subfamily)
VSEPDEVLAWLRAGARERVFDWALAEYRQKVFHLACAMLRDHAAAEDAAQEVFLRVWRALPEFGGRSSFSTWIYTIARNTILNRVEERTRRREAPLRDQRATAPARPDTRRLVEQLLAELPQEYRRVIVLYYLEERSYEETARMLDLPLGTVKTHLHRARRRMGEMLRDGLR